jgi:capsular polysaccharide biosynthesis protein
MARNEAGMEFREVLAGLRARWWLPVIGLILGGALALMASLLTTPQYTSLTQLFVSTTESSSTSEVFQGSQFSQQRVSSYAELLVGEELAGRVGERLSLETSPGELTKQIDATPVPNTVLIDVSVTSPSPEESLKIATAVGAEFTRMVTELETPDGAATSPVKVTVVNRPDLPEVPSEPQN